MAALRPRGELLPRLASSSVEMAVPERTGRSVRPPRTGERVRGDLDLDERAGLGRLLVCRLDPLLLERS